MNQFLLIVHAEHENVSGRRCFSNARNGLEAVQLWHGDIEDHQIWVENPGFFDGFAPVARLRDDIPFGFLFKQCSKPSAHDDMIVYYDDRGSLGVSPPARFAAFPFVRSI